jgi:glycine/D-amino acid oxidase-like deaminating enzyme
MAAGPRATDFAVIGAGICGTSVAAMLAGAGVDVTIYEREAVAAGASGRNSGVVQQPLDPALLPLYEGTIAVYLELAEEAPDAGFGLVGEPAGLLLATHRADALPALAARIASTSGLEPTIVGGRDLRAIEPALADGVAAIRLPIGFPIVPSAPTYAMATLAERRGVTIRLGRSVRPMVHDGRVVGVDIDGVVEPAGHVVVAAGPWSSGLVDPTGGWRPIVASWGVVVETLLSSPPRHVIEEADLDAVSVDSSARTGADESSTTAEDSGFSVVPVGDVCAVGSTFLDAEPALDPWRDRLLEHGTGFVPGLYEAPIREVRACARPRSIDGRPLIGPIPDVAGLFICSGHGPWGISTGPGSAALLAAQILGRGAAIDRVFDPARFGPVGGQTSSMR